MKIYLDAGHGGRDSGAVGIGDRLEKNDCQTLTNLVSDLLQKSGITTIVNTNTEESLSEVASQANAENVDLFVSIHRNAFNQPSANGLEVWTCLNARAKTKANAKLMYDKLMSVASEMTGRGIKESNFYVLKYTNAPAMLLEIGFITNQKDNELFDKYIFAYAEAITKGICEIGGVHNQIYTVQIGKYTDKAKADSILQDAKNKGFMEACIV
jgi:N-acetylmuramoyl-L-alanine amidase